MSTEASLQALEKALQLEIDGMAFYRKASVEAQNILTKEMFAYLADAEVTHMDRIKHISSSLKMTGSWGRAGDVKGHTDIKAVFGRLAKENRDSLETQSTDIKALDVGIDLEVKSIDYYKEQLSKSADANEKAFYATLIEEENTHFRTLKDMQLYLEDPQAWYAEHEHHGLDGA